MSSTDIPLPYPTNRTVEGPRIHHFNNQLAVEYDYQQDDGSIEWSKVVFADILAFEYRQEACCPADSVVAADEIHTLTQSSRLAEVVGLWNQSVGWQDWQQEQGGASRFKHFTIFFDDAGCIEVIAASCEVS